MPTLEQFNKKIMKEIDKHINYGEAELGCTWGVEELKNFITQKLTEHKALILTEVKERSYTRLKNVDVLDWDRFEDILDEIK